MATRQELLDTFEASLNGFLLPASGKNPRWEVKPDSKSAIMEVEQSVDGLHTIESHICYYWNDDRDLKLNQSFYVKDPGTVDEEAVWIRGNDPFPPMPALTFTEELTAWLMTRIDQPIGTSVLRHIEDIMANDTFRRATVNVILETSGGAFTRASAAIWKAAGMWQFEPLT